MAILNFSYVSISTIAMLAPPISGKAMFILFFGALIYYIHLFNSITRMITTLSSVIGIAMSVSFMFLSIGCLFGGVHIDQTEPFIISFKYNGNGTIVDLHIVTCFLYMLLSIFEVVIKICEPKPYKSESSRSRKLN